ncbi:MAG: FeoA family protein [Terrimicrobiaceae bacterium]
MTNPERGADDLLMGGREPDSLREEDIAAPVRGRRCLLSELGRGESGVVCSLLHHLPVSQRLMALGLIPGCRLRFLRNALWGDPMMVETTCGVICLRRREASVVWVDRES